jgi:dienelactone hydrolase
MNQLVVTFRSAALLVGFVLLLSACATTSEPQDRFAAGPFTVASEDSVVLVDSASKREVKVIISYPADAAEQTEQFPLIVFSHGAFCYPQQYANVTDFWVSHGYVVAFPNHLDSPNLGKIEPRNLAILLTSRIADMSVVLDSIADIEVAIPALAGKIDPDRAAVAGHSFGGMIAMVKSGLTLTESEQGSLAATADERFSAAVIMSGVGQMEQMTDDAFSGLTGPLFASGGTLDEGNIGTGGVYPWQWRMSPYTLAPAGEKYSLVLDKADHYLGGQICRDNKGGPDDAAGVRIVRAANLAFLDAYVKNNKAAKRWLDDVDLNAASNGRAVLQSK